MEFFNNFLGISDSKWRGIKGSLFKLVGLGIHEAPGTLIVNQKLTKISSTTITAFCRLANHARYG